MMLLNGGVFWSQQNWPFLAWPEILVLCWFLELRAPRDMRALCCVIMFFFLSGWSCRGRCYVWMNGYVEMIWYVFWVASNGINAHNKFQQNSSSDSWAATCRQTDTRILSVLKWINFLHIAWITHNNSQANNPQTQPNSHPIREGEIQLRRKRYSTESGRC
jgi:hypothetical protein